MTLDEAIGSAYHASEVGRDRSRAVADLRTAFDQTPELRSAAQKRLDECAALIRVRTRQACHITTVTHDLLATALSDA